MKHALLLFFFTSIFYSNSWAQHTAALPDSIFSGLQGKFHVQGAAIDSLHGHAYFSFTDKLIKTDLSGKLLGSVTGFLGHLGDLAFDQEEGKLYASLEYKGDAIGAAISKTLGIAAPDANGFYVVIFDVAKIVRPEMRAEEVDLLQTVYLREVVVDFEAMVKLGDRSVAHRHGCSGIDGVALGPAMGEPNSKKKYLYVAYGIYSDTTRHDNDHQVILQYDISNWSRYRQRLTQGKLHTAGPKQPDAKYFVKTGNTRYGIQNLEYDLHTGHLFAAVYRGEKSNYANFDLFVIDGTSRPTTGSIWSDNKEHSVMTMPLVTHGKSDDAKGVYGWHFPWGSTGLISLNHGQYYISHNGKTKDGTQYTTLYKYYWIGSADEAFRLVK